jgi:hypothetical protein
MKPKIEVERIVIFVSFLALGAAILLVILQLVLVYASIEASRYDGSRNATGILIIPSFIALFYLSPFFVWGIVAFRSKKRTLRIVSAILIACLGFTAAVVVIIFCGMCIINQF